MTEDDHMARLHESFARALCALAQIRPEEVREGDPCVVLLVHASGTETRVAIERTETGRLYTRTLS